MRLRVTPQLIDGYRKMKEGIIKIPEHYLFNCFLFKNYRYNSGSFWKKRQRCLRKLIRLGKEESLKFCIEKSGTIYPRYAKQEQVDNSPFSFIYRVQDYLVGDTIPIDVITANKCFNIHKRNPKLIHNLGFTGRKVLEVGGVELVVYSKIDAIQGLTPFYFKQTNIEPNLFDVWEQSDWKINALLLPETHTTNYNYFHFKSDKRMEVADLYTYKLQHDKQAKAAAMYDLEDFVEWIKDRPAFVEQLTI